MTEDVTVDEKDLLASWFERRRARLKAVAYRMLGSLNEAEDAVQEAWLRLDRADTSDVANLGGWLTTVVGRVCLDMLRARSAHPEEPLEEARLPDPVISRADETDPERQALLSDSVGLALLVVLEALEPAERLAFVLHDMFAVPFDDIAPIVGRSPAAARQLASRARRRVRGAAPVPDADLARQRQVVEAFQAAAHAGDFEALVSVLHPDVVLRADTGAARRGLVEFRGARTVAGQAFAHSRPGVIPVPVVVNGTSGVVGMVDGEPISVFSFTIADDRIVAIDILADPDRLRRLDLSALGT